jgi:hypothetical protein
MSAGGEPGQAKQDNVEQILNGMLRERQRLVSGVCEVTGTFKTRRDGRPEVNSDVVTHYAFDRAKNSLRYDNEESQYLKVVESAPGVKVTKESLKQFEGNIRPDQGQARQELRVQLPGIHLATTSADTSRSSRPTRRPTTSAKVSTCSMFSPLASWDISNGSAANRWRRLWTG